MKKKYLPGFHKMPQTKQKPKSFRACVADSSLVGCLQFDFSPLRIFQMSFETVKVGRAFECIKKNGKAYAGQIVKVAAYPRGTLVTVCYADPLEDDGRMYSLAEMSMSYRSIYLEECESWKSWELAPL